MKGDIVLVRFPFTDLSSNKLRPALVLSDNNGDRILSFITTTLKKEHYDVPIDATPQTGLKKKSLIKLNKITTLNKKVILGKIGNHAKLDEVDKKLKALLQL